MTFSFVCHSNKKNAVHHFRTKTIFLMSFGPCITQPTLSENELCVLLIH